MKYNYIDVHSHVHGEFFGEESVKVAEAMQDAGVATITVGTGLETSKSAIALAEKYEHIYATVGLHPVDDTLEKFDFDAYKALAEHPRVVAIGECGLDYHYITNFFDKDKVKKGISWNKDAEADRQQQDFIEQIELAVEVGKPLMLHGRPSPKTMDAYEDMCHILENEQKKHGDKVVGNFHFFVGNVAIAKRVLELGFTVSFSGVITFASEYDEVVRYVPLTSMHGETDSPYATPKPFRGKRNEPIHVREIYKRIAELRGEDEEVVRMTLLKNAERVFGVSL